MAERVLDRINESLPELRYERSEKRIRAVLGGREVVDSTRALILWEPRRIVPSYAVPEADIHGELNVGAPIQPAPEGVLTPRDAFAMHTADGDPVLVDGFAEGFRLRDPDLDGYVALDFAGFDAWYEEDERNYGHPRDPYHRIDIVHSTRHVVIELDGHLLAESRAPALLFETQLPMRFYLPPGDVDTERMARSDHHTWCAYKGHASYWSLPDAANIAWYYPDPLREAAEVRDRIAFWDERVDVVLDGERRERPITPF
jgi:uncharacterized protein (DUF427 family)